MYRITWAKSTILKKKKEKYIIMWAKSIILEKMKGRNLQFLNRRGRSTELQERMYNYRKKAEE